MLRTPGLRWGLFACSIFPAAAGRGKIKRKAITWERKSKKWSHRVRLNCGEGPTVWAGPPPTTSPVYLSFTSCIGGFCRSSGRSGSGFTPGARWARSTGPRRTACGAADGRALGRPMPARRWPWRRSTASRPGSPSATPCCGRSILPTENATPCAPCLSRRAACQTASSSTRSRWPAISKAATRGCTSCRLPPRC